VSDPTPKLKAVLFDFDGTLGDSYPAITASVNHVRGLHGLPPLSISEVRHHVGRGAVFLMKETVERGDLEANFAAYKAHHPSVMHSGTRLYPGVADALRRLHDKGLRLAVCSNKPVAFTRDLLTYFHIADYFDQVLGPEDVRQPKPAPDMLLEGLKRLGVSADQALYIGDMTVDIQTARAAGVRVWSVPTGSDDRETLLAAHPDRLLRDLSQAAELLT
jgi:2-phosphoglycolate phosphatase